MKTLLFASALTLTFVSASMAMDRKDLPEEIEGRRVFTDQDVDLPPEYDMVNPFTILVNSIAIDTIRDHKGEPHDHGHWFQLIRDGGNGVQDPPDPDGTPGGDDSLAWGNYNMFQLRGLEWNPEGKTGLLNTMKYFVPYYGDGLYYLRLWEGDYKTAKYYQDTNSFKSGTGNQGGGMMRMSPATMQGPIDVLWTFGPSITRPQAEKKSK